MLRNDPASYFGIITPINKKKQNGPIRTNLKSQFSKQRMDSPNLRNKNKEVNMINKNEKKNENNLTS